MRAASQAAWPGLDLLTVDSGMNPLLASYTGAPYMIRGTDPAAYASDARSWWQSLGQQLPDDAAGNGVTGQPASWTPGLPGWVPGADQLNAVGLGAAGVLLALLVIGFGLLVLWTA